MASMCRCMEEPSWARSTCPAACGLCTICSGHRLEKTYAAIRARQSRKQANCSMNSNQSSLHRPSQPARRRTCGKQTRRWLRRDGNWVALPCGDLEVDSPKLDQSSPSLPEPVPTPVLSACIQSFRDPPEQPARFVSRLGSAPFHIQIIVNDDGQDPRFANQTRNQSAWKQVMRDGDVYLDSANIHEVRAFNLMARLATAPLVVFLQGDNCLPVSPEWLSDAIHIFEQLPKLAILGGHAGFSSPTVPNVPNAKEGWGPYPRRNAIPHALRGSKLGRGPTAFTHVALTNIGPYFVRRVTFKRLGGFSTKWGAVGQPGGSFDQHLALQCWLHGHTVGVYYGGVGNGIGGHKTRMGGMQWLRQHHDAATRVDLNNIWWKRNKTVTSMILAENGQLDHFPERLALELQSARPELKSTCQAGPSGAAVNGSLQAEEHLELTASSAQLHSAGSHSATHDEPTEGRYEREPKRRHKRMTRIHKGPGRMQG